MPTPELPVGPGRTPVPAVDDSVDPSLPRAIARRDAAFREWLGGRELGCLGSKRHVNLIARDAFHGGWEARKKAQYAAVVNHPESEPVDKSLPPDHTLFPTEAELDRVSNKGRASE
jgi:hypothetical protein